jgi:hypothetical protein
MEKEKILGVSNGMKNVNSSMSIAPNIIQIELQVVSDTLNDCTYS